MTYLNLHITQLLRSPEYMGSNPVKRATWLNLIAYCAEQENGGRIKGARGWDQRQWPQMCGILKSEIRRSTKLWTWRADDLHVWGYPSDKEAEIKAKREAGKQRAARRWKQPELQAHPNSADSSACSSATSSVYAEGEREGEVERKESTRAREGSFAEIPAVEEVIAFGKMAAGIPEDYCRHYHDQRTVSNAWVKNGGVIKWKVDIVGRNWWGKDRETWMKNHKPGGLRILTQAECPPGTRPSEFGGWVPVTANI